MQCPSDTGPQSLNRVLHFCPTCDPLGCQIWPSHMETLGFCRDTEVDCAPRSTYLTGHFASPETEEEEEEDEGGGGGGGGGGGVTKKKKKTQKTNQQQSTATQITVSLCNIE